MPPTGECNSLRKIGHLPPFTKSFEVIFTFESSTIRGMRKEKRERGGGAGVAWRRIEDGGRDTTPLLDYRTRHSLSFLAENPLSLLSPSSLQPFLLLPPCLFTHPLLKVSSNIYDRSNLFIYALLRRRLARPSQRLLNWLEIDFANPPPHQVNHLPPPTRPLTAILTSVATFP